MKQGLSLRVSQHLALTPQLQQSIRLLQLSTLELGQEVDQMLDDNPFLERSLEEAERESFGLAQADTLVSAADKDAESAAYSGADFPETIRTKSENDTEDPLQGGNDDPSWEGDGSVSLAPDDSEWGGEARAHGQQPQGDDEMDATELARNQESLQSYLHRQALSLRLSPEDGAALRFLIESLNDDGYLEDPNWSIWRVVWPVTDSEQLDDLVHHFTVARSLLQSLEPVGVGACNLAQCLSLQLQCAAKRRLADDAADPQTCCGGPAHLPAQPMELLARRDIKHLMPLCDAIDAQCAAPSP
jgi:RNA polymerase sigma-54 factor